MIRLFQLTERQQQVANMRANGMSTAEIARVLSVHFQTIKTHLTNIAAKEHSRALLTEHEGNRPRVYVVPVVKTWRPWRKDAGIQAETTSETEMRKQIRGILTSSGWVTVRGFDVGRSSTLFIHRDLHDGKRQVVTHLPTGRLISSFETLKRAQKFATVLDGLASDIMQSTRNAREIPASFLAAVKEAHAAVEIDA